jgi:hypothetical protein
VISSATRLSCLVRRHDPWLCVPASRRVCSYRWIVSGERRDFVAFVSFPLREPSIGFWRGARRYVEPERSWREYWKCAKSTKRNKQPPVDERVCATTPSQRCLSRLGTVPYHGPRSRRSCRATQTVAASVQEWRGRFGPLAFPIQRHDRLMPTVCAGFGFGQRLRRRVHAAERLAAACPPTRAASRRCVRPVHPRLRGCKPPNLSATSPGCHAVALPERRLAEVRGWGVAGCPETTGPRLAATVPAVKPPTPDAHNHRRSTPQAAATRC